MSEDEMREHFERLWRFDMSEGFSGMSSPKVEQLKATCRAGYDEGVKACAAIKDAEIAEMQQDNTLLAQKLESLQSHTDTEIMAARAEIAARDMAIERLREAGEQVCKKLEHPTDSVTALDMWKLRDALTNSEHHNSRALEKMLLEAELSGLRSSVIELAIYREREILAKLAELNKE